MLGKVYGVDGLKTGGGGGGAGGGGGGTNCCACAWLSAPARRAIQPATKHLEKALRPNLANGISVFFKSPRAPKKTSEHCPQRWSGRLFTMSDEDFVDHVEHANSKLLWHRCER
jgi:hypothetical protein